MNQGTDTTESIDIRRALDRLQGTLEEFSDRYRELRRDRRQMHVYISELEREAEKAARSVSEHSQTGAAERELIDTLNERIRAGERRQSELLSRIGELDQAVRERESLVAEQEDLIQQYQVRFDDARDFASRNDTQRRDLETELSPLRAEVEKLRSDLSEALLRAKELEGRSELGISVSASEQVEVLSSQLSTMRQTVEELEAERAELVTKHTGLATEFETVRRSELSANERETLLKAELDASKTRATLLEQQVDELKAERALLGKSSSNGDSLGDPALTKDERAVLITEIHSTISLIDQYLAEA